MDDIYLGIQKEYGEELVNVDEVPDAVSLTTMNSKIEELISSNGLAKAVANHEGVEVKVLNPNY